MQNSLGSCPTCLRRRGSFSLFGPVFKVMQSPDNCSYGKFCKDSSKDWNELLNFHFLWVSFGQKLTKIQQFENSQKSRKWRFSAFLNVCIFPAETSILLKFWGKLVQVVIKKINRIAKPARGLIRISWIPQFHDFYGFIGFSAGR